MPPNSEGKKEKRLRYEDVRLQIRNGDVLMFKGRYFSSSAIKWLSGSTYSHAGIAVWWNKRLMIMEAMKRGVRILPLSRKISSYLGEVEWFSCIQEIPEGDRLKMVIFAQEELGKKYARWKTIVFGWKLLFKRDLSERDELRRESKLYCSQYVAQVYNSVGLDLRKDRADRFMSPDDIAHSPLLERKGVFLIRKRIFLQLKEGTQLEIE